jgi:hypothetical protein
VPEKGTKAGFSGCFGWDFASAGFGAEGEPAQHSRTHTHREREREREREK